MSATTAPSETEIQNLINYLRSLDADKLRRLSGQPAPVSNPPGFFGFIQQPAPELECVIPPVSKFGTPLFAVLPPTL